MEVVSGDNWSCETCSQVITNNKATPNILQAVCSSCHPINGISLKGIFVDCRQLNALGIQLRNFDDQITTLYLTGNYTVAVVSKNILPRLIFAIPDYYFFALFCHLLQLTTYAIGLKICIYSNFVLYVLTDAVCSKPVQLTNSRDEYLVTAVKHRRTFNIQGLSPFFWLVIFGGITYNC